MKTEFDNNENEALNKTDVSKSALITNKCKDDFINWYDKNYISVERFLKDFNSEQLFDTLHESFKLTLIVEWLDTIGINIVINIDVNNRADSCDEYCENCDDCYDTWNPEYEYCVYVFDEIVNNLNTYNSYYCDDTFESRKTATELAIKKANELYNEKVV